MFCFLEYLKLWHCKSYVHATAKHNIYHVRKAVNSFVRKIEQENRLHYSGVQRYSFQHFYVIYLVAVLYNGEWFVNRNETNLMAAACGITANAPAHRLPAVPPEGAGPQQIFLRRPPYRHRSLRTRLAGGMPRLHHHLADSAAAAAAAAVAKGEVAVLGPLRWILVNQH